MNPLNHIQARRYLQAAADNWLESSEQVALDAHLAACADCRAYAEQIGALEGNLRTLYHKQWDTASSQNINLLPGVRVRYRRQIVQKQLFSYASTLITICLIVGLLLLLNGFLSSRQIRRPAGNQTPTPLLDVTPTPVKPAPSPTPNVTLPTVIQPAVVPPAGLLVFVSSRAELADLYLMNSDGSQQRLLFDDRLSLSLSPAWSPDGKRLAFVSNQDGNSEIYTISADSANPVRLTDNPANDTDPAWSPNGKLIAFTSDRTGYREIYVMDADGLNVTQLTHTQALNAHPTWSPDGLFLAFASNRDGYWQIYRMNADSAEQINLSNHQNSDDRDPAWSPDGQRIVFSSQPIRSQVQEITVMNADGSGRVRLTDPVASQGQPASDFFPAWSPDSQWIAFCSFRDNRVYGDIYILRADSASNGGSAILRLTTEGGSQPAWKP